MEGRLQTKDIERWPLVEPTKLTRCQDMNMAHLSCHPFAQKFVPRSGNHNDLHETKKSEKAWRWPYLLLLRQLRMSLRGCTPSYSLRTRVFGTYLLGEGLFTLQKGLLGDGILHVNMFPCFKIPYITCTFLTKFTYNEYMGPLICANSETHIQRRWNCHL